MISEYVRSLLTKKAIKKAIKDSIHICLDNNQGLGCLYYTVLPSTGNFYVVRLNIVTYEYFAIIDYDNLKYHIVSNNLIVFSGDFRDGQDPIRIATHDFTVYRSLTKAIELACLGQWWEFNIYVNSNWETIMRDVADMDIRCSVTAHGLRLRVESDC